MTEDEQEAKTIATYDRTAIHWAAEHMVVNDWEKDAAKFKQLLPEGYILEVGCGGGRDAAELIRLGYDYYGTDASRGMVEAARQSVKNAKFEVRNVYDLAELGQHFDGFWACAVLLHIPRESIDRAIQAILVTQRTGAVGMISIKAGNKSDFEVRDKDGMHEERLFVYWDKDMFDEVLKRNGLVVLYYEHRPVSTRTNWHVYFVRKNDAGRSLRVQAKNLSYREV